MTDYANDCFAFHGGGCAVLKVKRCQGRKCPFYKTQKRLDEENRAAYFRLNDVCSCDIIDKYGLEGVIYK